MKTNVMFEYATRNKLRFPSPKGPLTVEQLWDVPLRSKDDFNLNTVAKAADKALKEFSENFVDPDHGPGYQRAEATFEIVKYVIETYQAEEQAEKKRAENKLERERLLRILAEKQEGRLSELSERELKKRIEDLN